MQYERGCTPTVFLAYLHAFVWWAHVYIHHLPSVCLYYWTTITLTDYKSKEYASNIKVLSDRGVHLYVYMYVFHASESKNLRGLYVNIKFHFDIPIQHWTGQSWIISINTLMSSLPWTNWISMKRKNENGLGTYYKDSGMQSSKKAKSIWHLPLRTECKHPVSQMPP